MSYSIYRQDCPKKEWKNNYIGETGRIQTKRKKEHAEMDKNSAIFIPKQKKYPSAKVEDFQVLAVNNPNRKARKLAVAMSKRPFQISTFL